MLYIIIKLVVEHSQNFIHHLNILLHTISLFTTFNKQTPVITTIF